MSLADDDGPPPTVKTLGIWGLHRHAYLRNYSLRLLRRDPTLSKMIPADARTGTTVGKYKLHEIVGRGGMGVVYRGEHVYIGKEVAVKILHEGYGGREESIKRFLREARAASLIAHPNIVDVTDFGKSNDGTVFFVMEFLDGEPLDAVLSRERRLDLLRAITILNQVAGALGAAHTKGIVHRDLKPENIMLARREGRRELVRQITDESGPAHHHRTREGVRLREDPRLRRRQGSRPRRQRRARHAAGRRVRDARVHGARDGAHRRVRPAHRRLRAGRHLLRDADRHGAVRGRDGGRRDAEGRVGARRRRRGCARPASRSRPRRNSSS